MDSKESDTDTLGNDPRPNSKQVDVSTWRLWTALSRCPECDAVVICQPIHGFAMQCPECHEMLAVLLGPAQVIEDKPPICALQLRSRAGNLRWVVSPGFYEFESPPQAAEEEPEVETGEA